MPSKCNKVKNPCKICLESVSNKTGLQCQGACKKWVHFTCLNYTPGKIKDIKQGIIKVTCPCPDCKTTAPKEYRTDEPFSCTNVQCPSNLPRSCISTSCPSNQTEGGCPPPLQLCEKEACKKNKTHTSVGQPAMTASGNSGPCPSDSHQSPHVRGDMVGPGGGALNVVEQICTTVGTLSNQINSLMNEMKTLMGGQGGGGGGGGGKPCGNNAKPKSCNCPGNPRR